MTHTGRSSKQPHQYQYPITPPSTPPRDLETQSNCTLEARQPSTTASPTYSFSPPSSPPSSPYRRHHGFSIARMPPPLHTFARLSDAVSLYTPKTPPNNTRASISKGQPTDPDLVVLCTWVAASPSAINTYTSHYTTLYPSAQILLITSTLADMVWRSTNAQRERLKTAIIATHACRTSCRRDFKLLLHLFSNGGGQSACQFAAAWQSDAHEPLPVLAMVFDSTPGSGIVPTPSTNLRNTSDALKPSLHRSPPIQFLEMLCIHFILMLQYLYHLVTGSENVMQRSRRLMNDERLFRRQAPRAYLYSSSPGGKMWWEDVEAHVEEASRDGWKVERVGFGSNGPVTDARDRGRTNGRDVRDARDAKNGAGEEDRYWHAVQEIWQSALRMRRGSLLGRSPMR